MNKNLITKNWEEILTSEEKIEYEFGVGLGWRVVSLIVFCAVAIGLMSISFYLIGSFILIIALFYFGFYLGVAYRYAFTNKRVLAIEGWLSKKLISIDYDKITDITVNEPFWERFLTKTGTISINTAGTPYPEIHLFHISYPRQIKNQLDQQRFSNFTS